MDFAKMINASLTGMSEQEMTPEALEERTAQARKEQADPPQAESSEPTSRYSQKEGAPATKTQPADHSRRADDMNWAGSIRSVGILNLISWILMGLFLGAGSSGIEVFVSMLGTFIVGCFTTVLIMGFAQIVDDIRAIRNR